VIDQVAVDRERLSHTVRHLLGHPGAHAFCECPLKEARPRLQALIRCEIKKAPVPQFRDELIYPRFPRMPVSSPIVA
jgi:hypothetical protein